MAVNQARFPTSQNSYGAQGGPVWETLVAATRAGVEQRVQMKSNPRHAYEISLDTLTRAQRNTLVALHYATRGAAQSFRFKDWQDYTATDENFGTGDGVTAAFTLRKTYATSPLTSYQRTITQPLSVALGAAAAPVIKVAGVTKTETTHYTINYATGVVTFTGDNIPTAAQAITWTGEFDVPVRFVIDGYEGAINAYELFSSGSLSLIEVIGEA